MTVENTTAPLYRDGSIFATNISCPYDVYKHPLNCDGIRYVNDFPIDVETLTAFQPYHVFKANEGAYVVLRHAGDSFDYKNVRQYNINGVVADTIPDKPDTPWYYSMSAAYTAEDLYEYNIIRDAIDNICNNELRAMFLVYGSAPSTTSDKINKFPVHDTVEPVNWTTGIVIPTPSDFARATFTLKFNTYVECVVGSASIFKPSITRSAPYDGEAFRVIRDFYLDHDGIYPANWNFSGKVNQIINRLAQMGKVGITWRPRPEPTKKARMTREERFKRLREIRDAYIKSHDNLSDEDKAFVKQAVDDGLIKSLDDYVDNFLTQQKRKAQQAGNGNRQGQGQAPPSRNRGRNRGRGRG